MNRRLFGFVVVLLSFYLQGCKRCQEDGYVKTYWAMRVWKSKMKPKKVTASQIVPITTLKAAKEIEIEREPIVAQVDNEEEIPQCSSFKH